MLYFAKKIPPYGKGVSERIKSKNYPNNDIYLFLGSNAWSLAKNFTSRRLSALVLPSGDEPRNYNWPVQNCDVLIVLTSDLSAHIVELTAQALLSAGALVVRVLLAWNGQMPAIYRR